MCAIQVSRILRSHAAVLTDEKVTLVDGYDNTSALRRSTQTGGATRMLIKERLLRSLENRCAAAGFVVVVALAVAPVNHVTTFDARLATDLSL